MFVQTGINLSSIPQHPLHCSDNTANTT